MSNPDHGDADGYRMEAWAAQAPSGEGYAARVVVRRLPALGIVFEDESIGDTGLWGSSQQALAAALERGRQFVRMQALGKVMQAAVGPCAPDDV